ncbi:adenylate/guanylate cyclase domain-containing protein [Cylindrospermum sp. FACHB-282]|uniref:adenylate/guanylate cyclase domain-containing protein n=1 Tax=Cylindrospermum sp. FACHB-282 TaxID=2692794 RepID=UPI001682B983|nr:adenylate/guanylate cyclase domain-containing protein [Cylindrospermum sp. FACHB-282]MBD2388009.1 HAMP domain-containing protein [Cylindrospermum sp. FACHB-282]
MKFFTVRSIRTQIMASTTLLILALVGAVVTVWAKSESNLYYREKVREASFFSKVLSYSYVNELAEGNWSQIRLNIDMMLKENEDFVYVLVSDARQDNLIVAASPGEFQNQHIPDIVPLEATNKALALSQKSSVQEIFVLREIQFSGTTRAKRGERVMEAASDIHLLSGKKIGTLRIGLSLGRIDRAVGNAVNQALMVGIVGLVVGLVFAYILAQHLSHPIGRLQVSAAKIAGGDLQHRAEINHRGDEIGALATSFNEMSAALQVSFTKLQKTLDAFERFVPNKFILAIAPQGVENIEVGVASMRRMTILFCDIRGYTSMSEVMAPIEIFTFLNDYLACMGQAIDQAGGFIDKYIGDAIMALFDDAATDGALKAAILMHQALDQFNDRRSQTGLPKISVGIGIHRGNVVMGTVGFTSRIESTVIGDAVNVAARIEGLTKQYDRQVLLSESVVSSLSYPEAFSLRLVDQAVKVKGKDEAIAIYELKVNSQDQY